jgi:hypothetical protein
MGTYIKHTKISVTLCVIAGLFASTAFAASPTSDGSLLFSDFDEPNLPDLPFWFNTGTFGSGTVSHDELAGNPGGSLRIDSQTPEEAFVRANMVWAPADWTSWVTEFDVKLNDTTGGDFILYGGHAPFFTAPIDIEIIVGAHDWIPNFYGAGHSAWDFRVIDATFDPGDPNSSPQSVVLRLDADLWHHFSLYRRPDNKVELWVDEARRGIFEARNPDEIYGEIQIGDVTQGAMFGDVNWDNFKVGEPNLVNVVNSILFIDDFSTGDLSKWIQVGTAVLGVAEYDGSVGNPDPAGLGSFHIDSDLGDEAFGRPDMLEAVNSDEWVTEFDFKVSNDVITGNFWIIYAAYAHAAGAPVGPAIDVEIGIWDNDYIPGFYDGGTVAAWDFHVSHGAGNAGLQPRLRADEWHHFTIHHLPDNTVDISVDGNFQGNFPAKGDGSLPLGDVQIGDVSVGNFFGDAHWDNFLITGEPWQGFCGDAEHPTANGDVNRDCHVDDEDLKLLSANWLSCSDPAMPSCFE